MVDPIDFTNVTQEVVAQSFAVCCSTDDPCDINNLQDCSNFRLGLKEITKFEKTIVRDRNNCFVRLYSAKWVVLGRHVEVGQHIVGRRLADVR